MDTSKIDWGSAAQNPLFKSMVAKKQRFLWTLMLISVFYYFLLPIGAGYFPHLFATKVFGVVNFGILFALSQFVVAWAIALIYTSRANGEFDTEAEAVRRSLGAN